MEFIYIFKPEFICCVFRLKYIIKLLFFSDTTDFSDLRVLQSGNLRQGKCVTYNLKVITDHLHWYFYMNNMTQGITSIKEICERVRSCL